MKKVIKKEDIKEEDDDFESFEDADKWLSEEESKAYPPEINKDLM